MALTRLSIMLDDAPAASVLAAKLLDLAQPSTLAISHFQRSDAPGWVVEAYYDGMPDDARLRAACAQSLPDWSVRATWQAVPDSNWIAVSQAALPPVLAGRFLVHGSHDRAAAAGRRLSIEIDAGEAFGTAHHASTRGCLVAMDTLAKRVACRRILDLGCGSGILAIAAAAIFPRARVLAVDIDPRAVAVARANAALNGVASRVEFAVAAGMAHARLRRKPFDLVVSNITAEPLIEYATRLRCAVEGGGYVILSGVLDREAARVQSSYVASGFSCHGALRLDGWTTIILRRRHLR